MEPQAAPPPPPSPPPPLTPFLAIALDASARLAIRATSSVTSLKLDLMVASLWRNCPRQCGRGGNIARATLSEASGRWSYDDAMRPAQPGQSLIALAPGSARGLRSQSVPARRRPA